MKVNVYVHSSGIGQKGQVPKNSLLQIMFTYNIFALAKIFGEKKFGSCSDYSMSDGNAQ